jgi:hypothetical protein
MDRKSGITFFVTVCLALAFGIAMMPLQAAASQCSTAATARKWDYTYTGTIFTANGQLPAASVGHFTVDAAGNLVGAQTRSVAGIPGEEEIAGTSTVNRDCTGTATIKVFVNGRSERPSSLWPTTTI